MLRITTAALVLLLSLRAAIGHEEARWCYECGTGVAGEPDCAEFIAAGTWTSFWRKCSGDSLCVKTVPGWNTSDESRAVRGCTPLRSLRGTKHQDGCWTHSITSFLTCYCSADLCNAAHALTPTPTALASAAFALLAVYVALVGGG
ncbi:uncharacterized protein LOC122258683 [Penaeus japonicus]|uniref:uncharacterized protein LOC122258683 n=1 Tax=Penaeus japonicus TaxID=27405 RepID=UPI001C7153DA|nr:uncharacterized protein LOC122258683 [Penaeus japonicus]